MSTESEGRPRNQQRTRQPEKSQRQHNRQDERSRHKQAASDLKPFPEIESSATTGKTNRQEAQVISDTVSQGRNGEQNITVEWYWEQIGNNMPCGWIIGTTTGNGLEATVNQLSYVKVYSSASSLKTGLVPLAPEGTKGTVEIIDTTTGEQREIKFCWYSYGLFSMLRRLIKRLFTNRKD
ncbi:MAG: hypothetical protein ACX936_17820 [Marinobacter sp.]